MMTVQTKTRIETLLTQAKSLSLLTYGNGEAEGFTTLKQADQDIILWLLSDLICEAAALFTGGGHDE